MNIRDRLPISFREAGVSFGANDNISKYLTPKDLEEIKAGVEDSIKNVLRSLIIDIDNDPNTKGTAERISRMLIDEVFSGRYQPEPRTAYFTNSKGLDDLMIVGPIALRSTCSHHFAPILGKVWVGVLPSETIIGISKFSRLIRWIASRPQIQEDMAVQIADLIEQKINPRGIAIYIRAKHTCMTWRGVKDTDSEMVTSVLRGVFRENAELRAEFLSMVK